MCSTVPRFAGSASTSTRYGVDDALSNSRRRLLINSPWITRPVRNRLAQLEPLANPKKPRRNMPITARFLNDATAAQMPGRTASHRIPPMIAAQVVDATAALDGTRRKPRVRTTPAGSAFPATNHPESTQGEQSAASVAAEADADSCRHGCIFHWPQSWAKTSFTSTGIPPTTGPGFDTVLTMRW